MSENINDAQLAKLRRIWSALGHDDPLWAVLSHPDKRGRRWNTEAFLATGKAEIDTQLDQLAASGFPRERGLAIDFGCGAGRLTRALAAHFDHVLGIDVSPSMIAAANQLNADIANIEFRENASTDLADIADASVDFVFSHITLQHIPTPLAIAYADEFLRILAPGGVAVFQFVDGCDETWRGRLFGLVSNRWLNPLRRLLWRRREVFEMHELPERVLHGRLAAYPALKLLAAVDDDGAGPGWRGRRWSVVNCDQAPLRIECAGFHLFVDPGDQHIGAPIAEGIEHDPHVAAVMRERLGTGDVVLDVGANIGSLTMLAASLVGPAGRVIAIEPMARNRQLIDKAARVNGFDCIEIIAAAASDHAGTVELRTHWQTSNSATPAASGKRLLDASGNSVSVPAVLLDEQLKDLDRLDLVKIDISGMEPLALRGFERTLTRLRPCVLSEFNPWAIERASDCEPIAYLRWLRTIYPSITLLHRDGRRDSHREPEAIMQVWRDANTLAGLDGRLHLDLMLGD
ncbi:MAG TPA: class I SAM-dependent methyltransferase [Dokdonella sp.]|uniref:class I SAM-dependent methyltransferase n=1 Tax=Dokdonella sp. TaxID=2291710 RepID=UPI002D7FA953|nr:class I SAM-dependent methyltransferase [Dokdonella sp.]HET9031344.1 class I SAM-dependent methyltransferase [Dokdonella sp.]